MTAPEDNAAEKAPPSFAPGKPRVKEIALDWPVQYAGKVYDRIALRRLTAAEVAAFVESLKDHAADAKIRWPIFFDGAGAPVPSEVMDALDADDSDAIDDAALNFLPRRFRPNPEAPTSPPDSPSASPSIDASAPSGGDPTGPSSNA